MAARQKPEWVKSLPSPLREQVDFLVETNPSSRVVLTNLYNYLSEKQQPEQPEPKRHKSSSPGITTTATTDTAETAETNTETNAEANEDTNAKAAISEGDNEIDFSGFKVNLDKPVDEATVALSIPSISFQSPLRKKLDLTFHLGISREKAVVPILSVVNPATKIPEYSLINLNGAVKFALLLPVLGNTTIKTKKNTVSLCIWLHEQASLDAKKNDPIICQLKLDDLTHQLIAENKIENDALTKIASDNDPNPLPEMTVQYLERQFLPYGVKLNTYVPTSNPNRNVLSLNNDGGIAVSRENNGINDVIMVEAYRGSKEGSLVLIAPSGDTPGYLIFGFRRPVFIIKLSQIKDVSFCNITRITFGVLIKITDESRPDGEESIEFSMIDQAYYEQVASFVSQQGINDGSYDEALREKVQKDSDKGDQASNDDSSTTALLNAQADSDEEEEDGTYTGGVEGEDESDSDLAEEFDSDADSGTEDLDGDDASDMEIPQEDDEEADRNDGEN